MAQVSLISRIRVGFMGRGADGLGYPNSQSYSKQACAFGLRSLSMLLTLSAAVKPKLLYLKYGGHRGEKGEE